MMFYRIPRIGSGAWPYDAWRPDGMDGLTWAAQQQDDTSFLVWVDDLVEPASLQAVQVGTTLADAQRAIGHAN